MANCSYFCSSAVVRKIRPPTTAGEECPRPGTGDFQMMFDVSLHSIGASEQAAMPFPFGPRQQGQSWSAEERGAAGSSQARASAAKIFAGGDSMLSWAIRLSLPGRVL